MAVWLVGCASQPGPVRPAALVPEAGVTAATETARVMPAARQRLEVVAPGATGMVVVNRRPIGLAPQTITVPVTPQGFLAEPVVVAVRFVARDVTEASMTVDTVLEVTDRAPARIEFDRDHSRRVFGDGL